MRKSKITSLLARLVPPRREIIVRSSGHVRYLGIGRFGQIVILLAVALLIGWIGYASTGYVSTGLVVAERNIRIATSDRIIRNMQGEIDALKNEIASRDQSIEQRTTAGAQLKNRNSALHEQISQLEAQRDKLIAERADKQSEIDRLNGRIADLHHDQTGLNDELQMTRDALQASARERVRQSFERSKLNERVAVLSDRLEYFEASQSESIDRLGEGADQGISTLERTLVVAGVNIPLMLKRVLGDNADRAEGVGGPLVAVADGPGSDAGERLAAVEQRLLRLQGLQDLMVHLPLAAPLDEYRLTSGFGKRLDPFTNQLAMHPGLDLASRKKIPVHVTAPGTVAFVGWKGGYGKVVEVDHGLGIRTRYAHLSRIFVKRGQTVEFREKVGLVGNTGRSTSTHLHYEIMVDGQQLDPANFLRAGQYVFKN